MSLNIPDEATQHRFFRVDQNRQQDPPGHHQHRPTHDSVEQYAKVGGFALEYPRPVQICHHQRDDGDADDGLLGLSIGALTQAMAQPRSACLKQRIRASLIGCFHSGKKPSPRRSVLPFRPPRDGVAERYDFRRDQTSDLVPRGAVTKQSEPEPSYRWSELNIAS